MSDPRDIPIGYGNCHGCWRHKSGAIWFDPTCPVHSPTPTEPGTPQTAADMAWEALAREQFLGSVTPYAIVHSHRPLIEEAIRAARDAEIRAAVEGLPEPTLGLKGGVSRAAVLAILDGSK